MAQDHEAFMAMAIAEARSGAASGEQPFGSVVVCDGEVVVRSRSLKVARCDPTAHSELLAISSACRNLGRRRLSEAVFYSTCEPCPMCLGALLNAGVMRLVLGARVADIALTGEQAFDFRDYSVESFAKLVGWDLELTTGILHEECVALYNEAKVELTR